jgi:predicted nucleic acid-binding protein
MTLVDAGPLIAMIVSREPDHERCVAALQSIDLPLVTTWSAFTEAMYLVGRRGGWTAKRALWQLVLEQDLEVTEQPAESSERIAKLMERYADRPMDLADATLVCLAEELGEKRIFTLDADFAVYRIHGRARFELVPG